MATTVSIAQAKERLSELVRRAELNGEKISITRRGKVVAMLSPAPAPEGDDWVAAIRGLCADCPEACDEIDKVYAERSRHQPRFAEL